MKTVSECQAGVSDILEAIGMLGCAHEQIDNHLISDYKQIPKSCVPDILDDSEQVATTLVTLGGESCPVQGEVQAINRAYRAYARDYLLDTAEVMKYTGGADMHRIGMDVEEAAQKIDADSGDLLLLPEITEIISQNTFRMFALFDACMRGK